MRALIVAVVIALTSSVLTKGERAQTPPNVDGIWRVEGTGAAFPWTLALRANGTSLTGNVTSCASNRSTIIEISDGRMDGNTIAFGCVANNFGRSLTFKGTVAGNTLTLTWVKQVRPGHSSNALDSALFGEDAPSTIVARRIAESDWLPFEGRQARALDYVRGTDLVAAVNVVERDVTMVGHFFLPQRVSRARALFVVADRGIGSEFYDDRRVRMLAESVGAALVIARVDTVRAGPDSRSIPVMGDASLGGDEALARLLTVLARESGHAELVSLPVIVYGHSAAGSFGLTYGAAHADRTIAFIRYQSTPPPRVSDLEQVPHIPALEIVEGAGNNRLGGEEPWKKARASGLPWTFAFQPGAEHGDFDYFQMSLDLVLPWISAVLAQRLPSDGGPLRPITDSAGWLGNVTSGEIAPYATFSGPKAEASWFPDEASARGWLRVIAER